MPCQLSGALNLKLYFGRGPLRWAFFEPASPLGSEVIVKSRMAR
jgi:hypothetical protein